MHVLLVVNEMVLGGAERYAIDLANSLVQKGATVTLSFDGPVKHVPGPVNQVRRLKPGRSMRQGLGLLRLALDLPVGGRIARYIRAAKVDVVNTVMLDTGIWAWLAGRLQGVPVFYTPTQVLANYCRLESKLVSTRPGVAFINGIRARFIALSRYYGWELAHLAKVPESRIRVASLGTDLAAFAPRAANPALRRSLGLADGPVLGTIARLYRVKGHHKVLASMPALLRECPHAQYLLVGDGCERAALEQQAVELGVRKNCIFTGWRTDTPELMALCDVYVQSTDGPNLGLAALQALAQAKPLVAFAKDSLEQRMAADTVREGINGHIVPTDDPQLAGRTIGRLLADRAALQRMGEESRRLAQSEFDWQAHAARVLEIYEEALRS
ncbi:MAG TPA: glycosyltransferase family 4 protein [Phycisphaerae bacterium]|jgi:glycosyltransferase involved in cell wall biosynthesis